MFYGLIRIVDMFYCDLLRGQFLLVKLGLLDFYIMV
jgi:hypothetical protein